MTDNTRLHIWSLDRMLVCVPSTVSDSLLESLRTVLVERPSVDGLLGVLTADGLAATPEFLCTAIVSDGVRVLIRGDLQAVAHGPGLSVPLSSGRSVTWHDDVITDIASITLETGTAGSPTTTFEWIATAQDAPPPAESPMHVPVLAEPPGDDPGLPEPDPAGAAPSEEQSPGEQSPGPASGDGTTLREAEFAELVTNAADDDQSVVPEPAGATGHQAVDAGGEADHDPLDFSNLLDSTQAPTPDRQGTTDEPGPSESEAAPDEVPPHAEDGADDSDGGDDDRTEPEAAPDEPAAPLPVGVEGPPSGIRPPISSVPGATGPSVDSAPTPGAVPPLSAVAAPPPSAPPDPVAPVDAATQAVTSGLGEHDGHTMSLSDLQRLRQEAASNDPTGMGAGPPAADPTRPTEVQAVRCPAGHPNPPTRTQCQLCGSAITDTGVFVLPRPILARLVFDSGLVVDVDRPQLIGRKPTIPSTVEDIPNLVTIPSPDSDISRSHTYVRIEGWDLLVEDVGSTNGTEVKLPNQEPVRIREFEPILVVPGTEVTLAGAVRFRVDPPAP